LRDHLRVCQPAKHIDGVSIYDESSFALFVARNEQIKWRQPERIQATAAI
jgi:hypothetical protein